MGFIRTMTTTYGKFLEDKKSQPEQVAPIRATLTREGKKLPIFVFPETASTSMSDNFGTVRASKTEEGFFTFGVTIGSLEF